MNDLSPPSGDLTRAATGRFGPGNPGRRQGSRNRASHRVIMAILEDFEAHQEQVLQRLREFFTPNYIDAVLRLLPPRIDVATTDSETYSEAEIAGVVRQARVALDRIEDGRGSLIELEAALIGEKPPVANAGGHRIYGDLR